MFKDNRIIIQHETVELSLDLNGGAIIDFHLKSSGINPLSFCYPQDQMPENNKNGAPYQGHFLCLGRWGEPSIGERNAGLPDHGQFANMQWEVNASSKNKFIGMQASSLLEGLKINREIYLDQENPLYLVKENVVNLNPLGRLFSMVQHPSLATPFLDNKILVNSNAVVGFDQFYYKDIKSNIIQWKNQNDSSDNSNNIYGKDDREDIVRSYIVNNESAYGWITAYSPSTNTLIGYLWPRKDYPWIHIWEHVKEGNLIYMGLEFGDTAIHQPFHEILNTTTTLFGEKTFGHIDAGETIEKKFISFIIEPEKEFNEITNIVIKNGQINLLTKGDTPAILININPSLLHELSS